MESDISAAILAGGSAKRLGGIVKPAIMVGGETILSRMLSVLNEVFNKVVLVSNSPDQFTQSDLIIVNDIFKGKGPLGGIHSALVNSEGMAVFVFAGDMPLIDKPLVLKQIDLFKNQDTDVVVPRAGALIEPLHAIYSRNILKSLEAYLSGINPNAVRDFLIHCRLSYFDTGNPSMIKNAFLNINSAEDIVIAEEILNKRFP
jgi:molybdopterin-guanine dinucleotide biosynthesis protein A